VTGATVALAFVCVAPLALADEPAKFVGSQVCSECHAAETERWRGSHHALAMQKARETTVLGDFANARFEHLGMVTTFSRSGDEFTVNTEGPDGALGDYEIAYTFGVYPLQQYLIAFPGGRAIRRSASPGTAVRKGRAVSAGSSSIRASSSSPATHCTGPGATRPGTTSAPTAIPPIRRRTTISLRTPMQQAGPISTWPARPATVRVPDMSTGRARMPQGAPIRRARTLHGWA